MKFQNPKLEIKEAQGFWFSIKLGKNQMSNNNGQLLAPFFASLPFGITTKLSQATETSPGR